LTRSDSHPADYAGSGSTLPFFSSISPNDAPATTARCFYDDRPFRIHAESLILAALHPIPSPEFTAPPPALAFDSD
jgi:hypothetical protein